MKLRKQLRQITFLATASLIAMPMNVYAQATDLSSTARTTTSADHPGFTSVVIREGGTTRTIYATDWLTPAEHAAVHQVLATGRQSVVLSGAGSAMGGILNVIPFNAATGNLTIPGKVTVLYNATSNPSLNLTGDLANAGRFYMFATNPSVISATINAANIYNYKGAVLSSLVPKGLLPFSTNDKLNIYLNASNILMNLATISSSGSLALSAGNQISNTQAETGMAPVISAMNNVVLSSPSIINQGTISSTAGNVALTTRGERDLSIESAGLISAPHGSIDINKTAANIATNLNVTGGDWAARQLNLNAPGVLRADLGSVAGTVNAEGNNVMIGTQGGNLDIGQLKASGDPTIYNTGGNVLITTPLVFPGENLAIVASGSIIAGKGAGAISTASPYGNGGDILMVAGAQFAAEPGPTLYITGPSSTGGNIRLYVNSKTHTSSLTTSGGTAADFTGNASGGDVDLMAYAASSQTGQIILPPGVTTTTAGKGTGTSGNVTMIAGNNQIGQSAIETGSVNTIGGTGGGKISLYAGQPTVDSSTKYHGDPAVVVTNSAVSAGKFVPDLTVGGNLKLPTDIKLVSPTDIRLEATGDVTVDTTKNSSTGAVLQAGILAPGTNTNGVIPSDKIVSPGSIYVHSVTGDVLMKRNAEATVAGGDLTLQAGRNISLESGNRLNAYGGNIGMFTDTGDISIEHYSQLKAVAQHTPQGCVGGGIYIWTEVPGMTLPTAISLVHPTWGTYYEFGGVQEHDSTFSPPVPPNGGYIEAVTASGKLDHIKLYWSSFEARGKGVISLRTPGGPNDKNLLIDKASLLAIGCGAEPPIPPKPPKPPIPPTPVTPPEQPAEKAAPAALQLAELQPTVLAALQRTAWIVQYAPESYNQKTSGDKVVLIGGSDLNVGDDSAQVKLAGVPVTINGEKGRLKRATILMREPDGVRTAAVVALSKSAPDGLQVSINGQTYNLKPGQLLLLSTSSAAPLVASADQSMKAPAAPVEVYTMDAAIALPEQLPETILLHTQEVPLRNILANDAADKRIDQKIAKANADVIAKDARTINAYTPGFPGACIERNAKFDALSDGSYRIARGSILVKPDRDMAIHTVHGTVYLTKDSMALISTNSMITRVRNMSAESLRDMEMVSEGKSLHIDPGKEAAVVSVKSVDPVAVVIADGVARRDIKKLEVSKNMTAVTSDFSILNVVMNNPLIAEALRTQEMNLHNMYNDIMKTAAVVTFVVDRYKGPYYSPVAPPAGGLASGAQEGSF